MPAPTNTRIYVVTGKDGLIAERLVRTTHPARAIEHVMDSMFDVRVASQDDLERLLPLGVKVERPGEAAAQSAPQGDLPQAAETDRG